MAINITRVNSKDEFCNWARSVFISRKFDYCVMFFIDDVNMEINMDAEVLVTSASNFVRTDWDALEKKYEDRSGEYSGALYGLPLDCASKAVCGISCYPTEALKDLRLRDGSYVGIVQFKNLVNLNNFYAYLDEDRPYVSACKWQIPIIDEVTGKEGIVESFIKTVTLPKRKPIRYSMWMGIPPKDLFKVTRETINVPALAGLLGIDKHDVPLCAALAIHDDDLSLKLAKKFLA